MSLRAMLWAFEQDCPSPAAKLVLIKLADHADDSGWCWPSQSLVAKDTGLARETVNRQVKALAKAGIIEAEARCGDKGQLSSRYKLRCDLKSHPPHVTENHSAASNGVSPPPSDLRSHPPVISGHTPCDLRSHKPTSEPVKEEEEGAREGAPPPGGYPADTPWFEGRAFRLNRQDFEAWEQRFADAYPNFWDELWQIDGKLAVEGLPAGKAFLKAEGWLNAGLTRWRKQRAPPDAGRTKAEATHPLTEHHEPRAAE